MSALTTLFYAARGMGRGSAPIISRRDVADWIADHHPEAPRPFDEPQIRSVETNIMPPDGHRLRVLVAACEEIRIAKNLNLPATDYFDALRALKLWPPPRRATPAQFQQLVKDVGAEITRSHGLQYSVRVAKEER